MFLQIDSEQIGLLNVIWFSMQHSYRVTDRNYGWFLLIDCIDIYYDCHVFQSPSYTTTKAVRRRFFDAMKSFMGSTMLGNPSLICEYEMSNKTCLKLETEWKPSRREPRG